MSSRFEPVMRDIKPANAIIADSGEVKLLDFGLAKLVGGPEAPGIVAPPRAPLAEEGGPALGASPSPDLTMPGALIGTPRYLAPELWRGEPATARSDLYALGALLYELCAGRPLHQGAQLAELRRSALAEAPPLRAAAPAVDPRLAGSIERCLRLDPAERPASAEELCLALEQAGEAAAAAPVPDGNPYLGLRTFQGEHRGLFFGRDLEVSTLLERLRSEPLVLVTGDSGIGKSSLCRAGVLPAVAAGALGGGRSFTLCVLSPGPQPLRALAQALAAALGPLPGEGDAFTPEGLAAEPAALGRRLGRALGPARGLLLLVDQAEELLTQGDDAERGPFAEALASLGGGAGPGVRVLLTVRGDFLARLCSLPALGAALERAVYILRPLSAASLREAIVGPARRKGVALGSEEMIDELVRAALGGGGLPLLQFALAELWEQRDTARGLIPRAALDAVGGVSGALGRHADGVLRDLSAEEGEAARRVLCALVSADNTRLRRRQGELLAEGPAAATRRALDALVSGRLLVARKDEASGEGIYELAHEALLAGWDTLRGWLAQSAEARAARQRLERAAAEWERLGRTRDGLWRDRQLADAARLPLSQLPPTDAAFLLASRRAARAALLRSVLGVGLPLLLLGSYFGALRLGERRARRARVDALLGEARGVLGRARERAAAAAAARARAFARFDAPDRDGGEAEWARALAAADEASGAYEESTARWSFGSAPKGASR